MQYGALHTHQRCNARSRSMFNIHNSHKLTAKKILSKSNNLNLRAERRLVQQSMSAVEEAVADSVEWNIVRMDLLAFSLKGESIAQRDVQVRPATAQAVGVNTPQHFADV
jgi:hypothetical protein